MVKFASLLAALATAGLPLATAAVPLAIAAVPQAAQAQTHGMSRRDDRRGSRKEGRTDKHDCNAAGGSSRSECRQTKRDTKQDDRGARASGSTNTNSRSHY
jgi:hypothetical protein